MKNGDTRWLQHGSIDPNRIPVVFDMDDYGTQQMLPGDVLRLRTDICMLWTGEDWIMEKEDEHS